MARFFPRGRPKLHIFLLAAVLVSSSVPADAGWLDRARGIGTGAQVYAQVSAFRSVKQNLGALTGLFGDMLDAVGEGDDRRVGEVWSDIQDVPGKIVRDAFPVLDLVESASAALEGVRERVGAAKARVRRLVGKAGGIASLASLAISPEERPFYEWTTGILGDEPLPAIAYAGTAGAEEGLGEASGNDDGDPDNWGEGSPGSEIATGTSGARERYDETLKRLDKTLAASSGVRDRDGKPEGRDYESRIEVLDRRRARYDTERREQAAAPAPAQEQETANGAKRDIGGRTAPAKEQRKQAEPQIAANSGKARQHNQDHRCRITCRQGSICVEYTLEKPSDCAKFSAQCQDSPGVTFERDHTCAPGLACRQRAPQRVSTTYDPSMDPRRFEQICAANRGKIVRK
ncbi:MAG: hypothetical protein OXI64_06030 [Defluviicoccus sp.]|nr:hypothetical protein [Defluviicoccus sp.]MDE2915543.1 hypothetical protein [Paracoccaceae bacterium]